MSKVPKSRAWKVKELGLIALALALALVACGASDGAADGSVDARPADGWPVDGWPVDGWPVDGWPVDGALAEARPPDGGLADLTRPDAGEPDDLTAVDLGQPDGPAADAAADLTPPPDCGQPDAPPDLAADQAAAEAGPDAAPTMPPVPPPPTVPGLSTVAQAGAPCTGPQASGPAVICVDDSCAAGAEQGTATAPYKTISAAVAAAKSGDTLQIAEGTYDENVAVVNLALTLLGGFAADFSSRTPASHVSTISAVGGDAALALRDAGASVVDGLRITGGTGHPWAPDFGLYYGGGIFAENGSPTIVACLIEANDTTGGDPALDETVGGGILTYDANAKLIGNVVRANVAGRGAGIGVAGGTALIEGNQVATNVAIGDHGGGIYAAAQMVKIVGNEVAGNKVGDPNKGGFGGGILVYEPTTVAELRGNVVRANHADLAGSGVFIDDGATATLRNELIYGNKCPADGGAGLYVDGLSSSAPATQVTLVHSTIARHACCVSAVLVEAPAALQITGSILWGNGGDDLETIGGPTATAALAHSLSEESLAGPGVLQQDPLFAGANQGDFHLRSSRGRYDPGAGAWVADPDCSPAIDAADPAVPATAEPAPNGARCNLGAYGGTDQASLSPAP